MTDNNSAGARVPGNLQIGIMLATICLAVLVTAILGPSLPKMEAYFSDVEDAKKLVPLSMTIPMLVMAVFCIAAGGIADRFGRKRLLVGACLAYGCIGTIPLYADNLYVILGSRVALGFAEAFIAVTGVTLIGDFFTGQKRDRILALQTTVAAASAVVLNVLGGALGDIGWRAPYAIYCVGFILAGLAALYLWEPERQQSDADTQTQDTAALVGDEAVDYKTIGFTCVLAIAIGFVFLTVPVNLGYLFELLGETSVLWVGIAYAINSAAVIAGSVFFGWYLNDRYGVAVQLAIACLLIAIGFIGMSFAGGYWMLTFMAIFAGLGMGIILPALVTWNMRLLPARIRGLGQGAFQAGQYFGQFLSGIAIFYLASLLGGRPNVILTVGVLLFVGAVISTLIAFLSVPEKSEEPLGAQ